MKRIAIALAAVTAIGAAVPAAAQPWQNINQRQAQLDHRIDVGVRNGTLTRAEAARLRTEFRQLTRLEQRYRRDGLSARERRDLDRRFDQLAAAIRYERRDFQRRG